MDTIYFSKRFLSGNIKGITVHGHVTYATPEQAATAYYVGAKGSDYGTKAKWIVTDASFQQYVR